MKIVINPYIQMAIYFSTEIKIEIKIYNNPCLESIIQKINFFEKLKLKNYFFLHLLKIWKTNFLQIYI